jgi:hypothetical protein
MKLRPGVISLVFAVIVLVAFGLLRWAGPGSPTLRRSSSVATPEAAVLRAYRDAFNQHNAEAVAALLSPTVKWFSVDTDKLSVEGDGREAIRIWLIKYFQAQPDVRSEFESLEQTGTLIAVREQVTWTDMDRKQISQQSHGVFEIRNGLITHVWYFPAARQPRA